MSLSPGQPQQLLPPPFYPPPGVMTFPYPAMYPSPQVLTRSDCSSPSFHPPLRLLVKPRRVLGVGQCRRER